jgi:hypothetical protein
LFGGGIHGPKTIKGIPRNFIFFHRRPAGGAGLEVFPYLFTLIPKTYCGLLLSC